MTNNYHGMKDTMDGRHVPMTSLRSGKGEELLPDLYSFTNQIVNLCLVGNHSDDWVLVDTGMPGSADTILKEVEERFGKGSKPKAIILTHGHFDHVGAVVDLVEKWDVPVYAHEAELPYLTGKLAYPEPDSSVEGGLVAKMSRFFPNEPVDLGNHVLALPADGSIPFMPEWKWLHTPGHSPGHVSLFRRKDRSLIVGDAFVTVRQDALYKVLVQKQEVHGPPRYYTTNWDQAFASVKKLQGLNPEVAVTGHGTPMTGQELELGLRALVENFEQAAVPDHGRFLKRENDR
ncbi:MBL fold metallo-hydrolase [Halobacillus sp. Marseille-Q1614]|uniref:MBL fold metallo-hydrolase n=1 Tax=Halobacillus sp. Marseille-Q1614 TaxID=2709134 RepID=UPI0020C1EA27|nr:MBL fold metallo-hydrolase [Halobacillus sp. Marseille-Q1614]